jgi:hypothetical protein
MVRADMQIKRKVGTKTNLTQAKNDPMAYLRSARIRAWM